jgi:hypothetical protein
VWLFVLKSDCTFPATAPDDAASSREQSAAYVRPETDLTRRMMFIFLLVKRFDCSLHIIQRNLSLLPPNSLSTIDAHASPDITHTTRMGKKIIGPATMILSLKTLMKPVRNRTATSGKNASLPNPSIQKAKKK